MRIKIGTFHDMIAGDISEQLTSSGIRPELKRHLSVDYEYVGYVEGRLSELKDRLTGTQFEDNVESWEEYVEAARDILLGGVTADEFRDAFVEHFVPEDTPSWTEIVDEAAKKILEERGVDFDDLSVEEQKEVYDEAMEESRDEVSHSFRVSLNKSMYSSIAEEVLELVEEDESGALKLSEDPELSLELEVDYIDEAEKLGADVRLEIAVSKMCDIYVDVMDGIREQENVEDLCANLDGANDLLAITEIVSAIYDRIEERGKVDFNQIKEELTNFAIGDKANAVLESGAPEEILRTLEKEKLVKVKRGKVKVIRS